MKGATKSEILSGGSDVKLDHILNP